MQVFHLSPDFVDERMLLADFLAACYRLDDMHKKG